MVGFVVYRRKWRVCLEGDGTSFFEVKNGADLVETSGIYQINP